MEKPIYMHEVDCLPFFRNVVQSKLIEAEKHLKKVELYKRDLDQVSPFFLEEIIHIYDEQSEFIAIAQTQCRIWCQHGLSGGQTNKVKDLEKMIQQLESTTYHIMYIVEHIQRAQNLLPEEGDEQSEESVITH